MSAPLPSGALPFLRLLDAANLLTGLNVVVALASAALALHGVLAPAAAGVMLAAIVDLLDGHVARRLPDRPAARQAFGAQLDSLADLLNFSVVPAVILAQLSASPAVHLAGAALVLGAALRLAWFAAVPPPCGSYAGLPTTYAGCAMSLLCHAAAVRGVPDAALATGTALLAVLQLCPLRLRKFPAVPAAAALAAAYAAAAFLIHH